MNTPSHSPLDGTEGSDLDALVIADRYRVLERLGAGGDAEVFSVRDLEEGRDIALKRVLEPDASTRQRVTAEFEALAQLRHRNIVVPYRLFVEGQRLCYTMELIEGRPLLACGETLRREEAALRDVVDQLVNAIEAIHEHGLVHGDLSPGNVLLGAEGRVVLLDLGSPRRARADREWSGTPPYMAPELFTGGERSPAADWYALGALLYECLTGRMAFPQPELARLCEAKRRGEIATLDATPEFARLARVVEQLLDPSPDSRADGHTLRAVLSSPGGVSPPDRPAMGPMIGRRHELAALQDRLAAATGRRRIQVVSISGEPGIGKTRLLDSFCGKVRHDGLAFALRWRCPPAQMLPLRILGGLLDDLVDRAREELPFSIERCYPRHAQHLREVFASTAALFGVPTEEHAAPALDELVALDLAAKSAADLLVRVSEHVPLLLCLDDMHRSDADSSEAVLRLLLALGECPVLCLLAHAEDRAAELASFLDACRRHLGDEHVTELRLGELPREQLVAIAWEQLASWQGPASIVEGICEGARGNPGMCVWYARALRADPEAELVDRDTEAEFDESVFARIWARLSDDARELSGYLALAHEGVPRSVLRALLRDDQRGDAATLELEQFGFLLRSGATATSVVSLWHERIAEHALARLDERGVVGRHRELGEAFARGDWLDRAGHHFRAAGRAERAVECFARAAERALSEGAHNRATALLEAALAFEECGGAERQRLEIRLAESLGRLGRLREAAELGDRLSRAEGIDPSVGLRLRQRSIGAFGALADTARVKALFDEAVGVTPGSTARMALARLVALRVVIAARPPWKSPPRPERAESEHELDLLWNVGSRLLHLEPLLAAYLISRHMLLAFRHPSLRHQARALAFEAVMLTTGGDKRLTQASTLLAAAERRARQCDDEGARAAVHQGAGFMWGNVARYREAIEEGRRCIEILEHAADVPTYEITHARMELGWRLLLVGEYREVLTLASGALRDALECEDPVLASAFHVQLANAHVAADRPADGLRHLEAAEQWCPPAFEVGRLGIFIGRIAHHLYVDEIDIALEYLAAHRKQIESLRILGLPAVRTMYRYRVGVLLSRALPSASGAAATRLRKDLARVRRKLRGESFEVALAHARLLDASHHAFAGEHDLAMGHLREAVDRFAALGWHALATMARRGYRALQGANAEPHELATLSRVGIAHPQRWAATALPELEIAAR